MNKPAIARLFLITFAAAFLCLLALVFVLLWIGQPVAAPPTEVIAMRQTEAALRAVFERAVKRQQDKSAGAQRFPPDPIEDAYLEGCRDMAGWILGEYDGEDMLLALLTDADQNAPKHKRRTTTRPAGG